MRVGLQNVQRAEELAKVAVDAAGGRGADPEAAKCLPRIPRNAGRARRGDNSKRPALRVRVHAVGPVHHAVGEPALGEQFEVQSKAVWERRIAASRDHGVQEEVALVDEAGLGQTVPQHSYGNM